MWKSLPIAITFFLFIASTVLTFAPGQRLIAADQNTMDRLNQLDSEAQALRAEVSRMRQDVVRLPMVESNSSATAASATSDAVSPAPPVPWAVPTSTVSQSVATQLVDYAPGGSTASGTGQEDYYTMDEIKAEMKKLVWKKGDFSITPYGYVQADMIYETERSNTGDYTFYVFSAQDQGEPTFHVDAKSTRLGVDLLGPKIACLDCAQSGGKVEFDFQGTFVTENKGSVLLRHAYFEVKDEDFRLLAGQTWDIISPLNPNSIMYSVYWGAGNIGYRRAQFRGEKYIAFSDELLWTNQGSINSDIVSDTASNMSGDHSGWPVIEGRTALTFGPRGKGCNPIVFGASSHIGEQRFTFTGVNAAKDLPARTWSFNLDLKVPVTDRLGFQGECYVGENLSAYLGGILQGYDPILRQSIYDQGGWMEVWYYWSKQWHSHVGYCVDDPLDSDISFGGRTYNQAYFGNIIYDVTKQFNVGFEASSWRTLYNGKTPGESTRLEFMARYGF